MSKYLLRIYWVGLNLLFLPIIALGFIWHAVVDHFNAGRAIESELANAVYNSWN